MNDERMSCGSGKNEMCDTQTDLETLQTKLGLLQKEIDDLQKEGYHQDELQDHITKLHEYNEIKDVGQMVLGRIADIEGVRTKDMYGRYGLSLDD
ncbi:DNA repair protein SWI5 homolog isoform X2 [Gigantopelta aegis]|uniref:DNA repair protein SWI5 homolog isoform X2 n=1 Tax=Gigantopelta aegis TaxID=1735272 RepID=UPI001B88BE5F|nr:DNA repair protein SWI5 homolog isoform X2 [Gigantopelta aegis]